MMVDIVNINRRSLLKSAGTLPLMLAAPQIAQTAANAPAEKADYTLRIATGLVELSPEHIVSTTLYNGQFPGPMVRLTEGKRVVVDIHNDTDTPEQLHWHGQFVPVDVDGAAEEGTPYIPAHGMRLAAWSGFTLPSAVALVLFAYGAGALSGATGAALLHGLKLVAVAIVAQAVWGMARTLCPDRERASIAVVAALIILLSTSSVSQIGAILLGGFAGLWLCRGAPPASSGHVIVPVSRTVGLAALSAFFLLLVGLPLLQGTLPSQA